VSVSIPFFWSHVTSRGDKSEKQKQMLMMSPKIQTNIFNKLDCFEKCQKYQKNIEQMKRNSQICLMQSHWGPGIGGRTRMVAI
jgi:hypothetical protein